MKINLWGGIPRPIGGQTSHIYQLATKLTEMKYFVTVIDPVYDTQKYSHEFKLYFLRKNILKIIINTISGVNHVHVSNLNKIKKIVIFLVFALLLFQRKYSILTIHSGQFCDTYRKHPVFRKRIILFFLNQFGYIIAINDKIANYLKNIGYRGNITLANSYIKNNQIVKSKIFTKLDIKIITTGYLKPVYNYEGIILVCGNLIKKGYEISLNILIYGDEDKFYKNNIMGLLNRPYVNVIKAVPYYEYLELLANHDIYIRNTDVDSYGLAVAEAISVGTPVLATDVCKRAEGSILYKCRDYFELEEKVEWLIKNYKTVAKEIDKYTKLEHGFEQIKKLYDSIIIPD